MYNGDRARKEVSMAKVFAADVLAFVDELLEVIK
jgi:hypothetical protein